jgi:hypothetical protein
MGLYSSHQGFVARPILRDPEVGTMEKREKWEQEAWREYCQSWAEQDADSSEIELEMSQAALPWAA